MNENPFVLRMTVKDHERLNQLARELGVKSRGEVIRQLLRNARVETITRTEAVSILKMEDINCLN